jgi:hypothetical protein
MPTFGPINRKELVRCLKQVGFEGPYSGGRHQFMVKGTLTIHIPNPHEADSRKRTPDQNTASGQYQQS